jgi:hypothetical protein
MFFLTCSASLSRIQIKKSYGSILRTKGFEIY